MKKIEHIDGADYWTCPCRQCWSMELDALDDSTTPPTYDEWKAERLPWQNQPRPENLA